MKIDVQLYIELLEREVKRLSSIFPKQTNPFTRDLNEKEPEQNGNIS